jgi:hypothetical protein
MIDWLIDWLIEWLNDWMIEWLNDWMIEWLNDWMIVDNKRQGPGACDLIVGGFGNPYGPTVQRGDRGPPWTSGTLSVDVVDREKDWLAWWKRKEGWVRSGMPWFNRFVAETHIGGGL